MPRGFEIATEPDNPINTNGLIILLKPEPLKILSWDQKGAGYGDDSLKLYEIDNSLVQPVVEIVFSDSEYHQRENKVNETDDWLSPDLNKYTQTTEQKVRWGCYLFWDWISERNEGFGP